MKFTASKRFGEMGRERRSHPQITQITQIRVGLKLRGDFGRKSFYKQNLSPFPNARKAKKSHFDTTRLDSGPRSAVERKIAILIPRPAIAPNIDFT
ncbi:MAG: hypothetical protein WD069_18360 [Planctomycetales bacterium]